MDDGFARGVALFNAGDFFAAHEVLEDVWRDAEGPDRRFLQALIQFAVALHHLSTGNRVGARSLLAKARSRLDDAPPGQRGLDVPRLRAAAAAWLAYLDGRGPEPPFPRL